MIGTVGFTGSRLKEAMQARGITSAALAEILGVGPMAVSQYVNGRTSPRPDVMRMMSQVLNLPETFFKSRQIPRVDDNQEVFWRSFSSASKTNRIRASRRFRWLKNIVSYLGDFLDFPAVNVPWIDSHANILNAHESDIEKAAINLRVSWGLGMGPISDLSLLLENNGVIVCNMAMETEALDAFSQWSDTDKFPYIVLSTDRRSAVRDRYNAGHELGHLLLHRTFENPSIRKSDTFKLIESQAFLFGAAFLLPAQSFIDELWAPTLDAFRSMKGRWKVSIGVMIKRCEQLGIVTEEQARRLWINYSRRGWRTVEPLDEDLPFERPRLLRRSIEMLVSESIKSKQAILDEFALSANDIEEICSLPRGYFSQDSQIAVMPKLRDSRTNDYEQKTGVLVPFGRKN